MTHEYITHYEVWKGNVLEQWGNQSISVHGSGEPNATDLAENIRADAAKSCGCAPAQVRILGVFKI